MLTSVPTEPAPPTAMGTSQVLGNSRRVLRSDSNTLNDGVGMDATGYFYDRANNRSAWQDDTWTLSLVGEHKWTQLIAGGKGGESPPATHASRAVLPLADAAPLTPLLPRDCARVEEVIRGGV